MENYTLNSPMETVSGQGNFSLQNMDQIEMGFYNLTSSSVFPPQQEMLNLASFNDLAAFHECDSRTNLLRSDTTSGTSDLNSLSSVLDAKSLLIDDAMANNNCDIEILSFVNDADHSLFETLDLSSGVFGTSHLHSETFPNIEDFIGQTTSHEATDVNEEVSSSADVQDMELFQKGIGEEVNEEVSSSADVHDIELFQKGIGESGSSVNLQDIEAKHKELKKRSTLKSPQEKYMEMRRKNNIASRRSRQIRKEKNEKLASIIIELEQKNKELKSTAEQLEKQKDALKNYILKTFMKRP